MESVIGFGGLGGVSEGLKMVGVVEKSLGMIIRVKERPLATERAVIVVVDFASGKKKENRCNAPRDVVHRLSFGS